MACVNKSAIIGHYFHFQIALHIPKRAFQSSFFFSLHFENTHNSEILLSKVICTQFYDCVNLNISIDGKEREILLPSAALTPVSASIMGMFTHSFSYLTSVYGESVLYQGVSLKFEGVK